MNASTRPDLINIKGLNKRYKTADGKEVVALHDVNFSIPEGQLTAVVGPSGCGKSTLLKIFAGLHRASEGEIVLRGQPVVGPRRDIGVVFQDAVLLPWLTVLENVVVPAKVQKLDLKKHVARAGTLLDMVGGLRGFEGRYPNELSGGMRQRVSIARALVHDPSILLMDEPFGALDAMTREHMNLEVQRIWMESKKTIFFITHSIPEAVFLADRVLVMSARPGRIIDDLQIDLPRPRMLELMATEGFGKYANHIRGLMSAKGSID